MAELADVETVAKAGGWYRSGGLDMDLAGRAIDIAGSRPTFRCKEKLSEDRFDEIKDDNAKGDEIWDRLQEAESLLVVYYALPRLNQRLTKKGGLQRQTGLVDNENDLMSHQEMERYRDTAYADAMDVLADLGDTASDASADDAKGAETVFAL